MYSIRGNRLISEDTFIYKVGDYVLKYLMKKKGAYTAKEISEALNIPKSFVSGHCSVLERHKLLKSETVNGVKYYSYLKRDKN